MCDKCIIAGEPGDELGDAGGGGAEGAAPAGRPQQRAAQPTAQDRLRRKPGTRFEPSQIIHFAFSLNKLQLTVYSIDYHLLPSMFRPNRTPSDKRVQYQRVDDDDDCQNPAPAERRKRNAASSAAAGSVLRQREGRPYILIKVRPKWMRERPSEGARSAVSAVLNLHKFPPLTSLP